MPPLTIVPMKTTPQPTTEENASERSLIAILGAFLVGVTFGIVTAAGIIAALPTN